MILGSLGAGLAGALTSTGSATATGLAAAASRGGWSFGSAVRLGQLQAEPVSARGRPAGLHRC